MKTPEGLQGEKIGRVQFMHSSGLSIKAICERDGHMRATGGADDVKPRRAVQFPCYVLMKSTYDVFGRYRMAIRWLLNGQCCMEEHQRRARVIRESGTT